MTIGGIEFDWKLTLLIVLSTLVPMLDWYNHKLTRFKAYDRFVWYFVIPALVIVLLFREPLTDYGFRIGNWRIGLAWTAVACIGMGIILYFFARSEAMQHYYSTRAPQTVWRILYLNGVEMFAWEFMWRGALLFAFARAFGPGPAIFLQAVPFAFMHLGKPEVETLTTIFGGAGFGFVAWQSDSFLYPFLIHWFMVSFTMLVATGKI